MKRTKKLLSVLLALLLLLSFGTLAFAQEDPSNPSHEGRDCEWDKGRVVTAPTCTQPGEKLYTCKINALHTKTEVLPATNHDYEWTITENSSATAPGTATAVCKNNPAHTESMTIPARGTAVEVGYCGTGLNHAYYAVYEDGTLLIFGEGAIKAFAFMDRKDVHALIIGDGITEIGNSAFAFIPLDSIDFGNTVEIIGDGAFYDSDGFEDVVLPDSVRIVERGAFSLSSYLKTVTFGPNVEFVGDWALLQCYKLEKVVFLNKDTQIEEKDHSQYHETLHTIHHGTIFGFSGGSVEAYANQYGFAFVDLTTVQPDTPQEPDTPDTPATPEQPQEKEKNAFEKIVDAIKRFFASIADFFRNLIN